MRPRLSIILPAFNEERVIVQTLRDLRAAVPFAEVIVVADGDDSTRARAASVGGVRVMGSRTRRGKGLGVGEGILQATGDVVGYIDADGKVPPTEMTKIWPEFERGADMVIGTRRTMDSAVERQPPWFRQVGSHLFHCAMRQLTGLHDISDSQCGFKFFRREVAQALFAQRKIDGYMFDVEILALARQGGWRIHQVPVRWADDGDSRLELWRGNWRNLRDLIRIARRF